MTTVSIGQAIHMVATETIKNQAALLEESGQLLDEGFEIISGLAEGIVRLDELLAHGDEEAAGALLDSLVEQAREVLKG